MKLHISGIFQIFYLPQFNIYIEIKGWEKKPSQLDKRNWLREQGIINLIDVFGDTYNPIKEKYQNVLPNWE